MASANVVSGSHRLKLALRTLQERWALVLDGAEVAQVETGAWQGRFLHPELYGMPESASMAHMKDTGVAQPQSRPAVSNQGGARIPAGAVIARAGIHDAGTRGAQCT